MLACEWGAAFHVSKVNAASSSRMGMAVQQRSQQQHLGRASRLMRAIPEEEDDSSAHVAAAVAAAAFISTASLVGMLALQQKQQEQQALSRFACISSAVSCAPDNTDASSPAQENAASVEQEALSPEMQREFEQWKKVPYALTVPLRIVALRGSVPVIWLQDFTLSQGRRLKLKAEFQSSLDTIFKDLLTTIKARQIYDRSTMAADLVTVGDSWLGAAIVNGAIVPIGRAEQLDWFQRLHPRWQALLQRDGKGHLSTTGDVWGAPYRCGCMLVAYRKDKLTKAGIQIKDWQDLWKPELAGRISVVNSTREVVGMVLKSLGASYNTANLDEVAGGKQAVKEQFNRLRKQVKVFDDVNYLKALGTGDVWVAVGWSGDVLPFAKRTSNIGVIAPASGTSIWADLWAIPAATTFRSDKVGGRIRGPSPMVSQWLDFCLQPARSLSLQQADMGGASPLSWTRRGRLDYEISSTGPRLDTNTLAGMPPKDILARSEFLEPLQPQTTAQYEWVLQSLTGSLL